MGLYVPKVMVIINVLLVASYISSVLESRIHKIGSKMLDL